MTSTSGRNATTASSPMRSSCRTRSAPRSSRRSSRASYPQRWPGTPQRSRERWAHEEALPELEALIAKDDYTRAFDLARRIAEVVPDSPQLRALAPSYSAPVQLETEPASAKVYFRPYESSESDWRPIGETPLENVPVPIGIGLWRIEREGRSTALRTLHNPGAELRNVIDSDIVAQFKDIDLTVRFTDANTAPKEMVFVPATNLEVSLVSDGNPVDLPAFYIDRFEVTNREYKEFVGATGRPGPATWDSGVYPDGTADHPVAGVSWFEAMAYARLRGKGTAPVGRYQGIGPYGTHDMAGNVREWLWTAEGRTRVTAGGAWNQPPYLYNQVDTADPWNRSAGNGFRCMRTLAGGPVGATLRNTISVTEIDFGALAPVDDDAYAVPEQQLRYSSSDLAPQVETPGSSNPLWKRERISLPTGYDETRFNVQLFLPAVGRPPYQVIFYLPRVTQPVLMLSGRWDINVNQESQATMLRLLGTPPDRKQRILFDAGHGWLPQQQFVRATLDWYDRYPGPTTPTEPGPR